MSTAEIVDERLLRWLDAYEQQVGSTVDRSTKVLAQSLAQTLADLRIRYEKLRTSVETRDQPGRNATGREQRYSIESQTARYRELLDAAGSLMDPKTVAALDRIYQEDLSSAYALGGEAAADLQSAVEARTAVSQLTKMPVAAIERAGSRLNQFWDREALQMREKVTEATIRALQQGKGWKAASLEIEGVLRSHSQTVLTPTDELSITARGGVPMSIVDRANLIARTELASAYVEGVMTQYRASGYSYGRWSATGERACPYCVSREGVIYHLDDLDGAIPAHPRCRCTISPVPDSMVDKVTGSKDKAAAAARYLDDAAWTRIRQGRFDEYAKASKRQRPLDPKKYIDTPTNRQQFLRPGTDAPAPVWMPSGGAQPDLKMAQASALRGQAMAEQEAAAAEARNAEKERAAAAAEAAELARQAAEAAAAAEALRVQAEAATQAAGVSNGTLVPKDPKRRAALAESLRQRRAALAEQLKAGDVAGRDYTDDPEALIRIGSKALADAGLGEEVLRKVAALTEQSDAVQAQIDKVNEDRPTEWRRLPEDRLTPERLLVKETVDRWSKEHPEDADQLRQDSAGIRSELTGQDYAAMTKAAQKAYGAALQAWTADFEAMRSKGWTPNSGIRVAGAVQELRAIEKKFLHSPEAEMAARRVHANKVGDLRDQSRALDDQAAALIDAGVKKLYSKLPADEARRLLGELQGSTSTKESLRSKSGSPLRGEAEDAVVDALAFYGSAMGVKGVGVTGSRPYNKKGDGPDRQGSFVNTGEDWADGMSPRSVALHEFGHAIEHSYPDIAEATNRWRFAKAGVDPKTDYNDLPSIGRDIGERGLKLSDLDTYAGRVYPTPVGVMMDGRNYRPEGEVLTTVYQTLAEPAQLAKLLALEPDRVGLAIGALRVAQERTGQGTAEPAAKRPSLRTGEKVALKRKAATLPATVAPEGADLVKLRKVAEDAEQASTVAQAAAEEGQRKLAKAEETWKAIRENLDRSNASLKLEQEKLAAATEALAWAQAQRAELEGRLGIAQAAEKAARAKKDDLITRLLALSAEGRKLEQQAAGGSKADPEYDRKVAELHHDKASLVKMGEDVLARAGIPLEVLQAGAKAEAELVAARRKMELADKARAYHVFGKGMESVDEISARLRSYGMEEANIAAYIDRELDHRRAEKAKAKEEHKKAWEELEAASKKNNELANGIQEKAKAVLGELLSSSPISKAKADEIVARATAAGKGKPPANTGDIADAVHLYGSGFGLIEYSDTEKRAHAWAPRPNVIDGTYDKKGGRINAGGNDSTFRATQFHELAHLLEGAHADINAASREFIISRAERFKNGSVKPPAWLGRGYDKGEKAYKGETWNRYILKDYSSYYQRDKPGTAYSEIQKVTRAHQKHLAAMDAGDHLAAWRAGIHTEVVAMGAQNLSAPHQLLWLLDQDQEHGLMTLGMVRLAQARTATAIAAGQISEGGDAYTDASVTNLPAATEATLPRSRAQGTGADEAQGKAIKARRAEIDAEIAKLEPQQKALVNEEVTQGLEVDFVRRKLDNLPGSKAAEDAEGRRLAKEKDDLDAWAATNTEQEKSVLRQREIVDKVAADAAAAAEAAGKAAKASSDAKAALVAAQAEPTPIEARVGRMPIGEINADASRFQYKVGGNSDGEVGSLRGVRTWNEDLAGILSVWTDPADGRTYVINGHNRLALARRLGAEELPVLRIEAATALEARAIGALQNIANGDGTAIDAAKFMRDTGESIDGLQAKGLNMKGRIAADGAALAALPQHVFDAVSRGDLAMDQAVLLGRSGLSEVAQGAAYKVLQARPKMSLDTLAEVLQQAAAATTSTRTEATLFGTSETQTSNLLERAELAAKVRASMNQEQRLLERAGRNAAALEKGGNRIDRQAAAIKAAEAALRRDAFDLLKNRPGPLADALNTAADAIQGTTRPGEKAAATRGGGEAVNAALDQEIARLSSQRGGLLVAVDNLKRAQQGPAAAPEILKAVIPSAVRERAARAGISVADAKVGDLVEVKVGELLADPKRFQYKASTNSATGEVGSLEGVQRWDPNLGGVLTAWIDPADGRTYVINGHNRLAAAKRLGAEAVAVRFIKADSAEEARANGALTNIAEGHGTAIDAAKFLRSRGWGVEQLESLGVPLKKDSARQGAALARLPESVFAAVVDETLSVEKAALLGESRLDGDAMEKVARIAALRPLGAKAFAELVQEQEAKINEAQTMSLFGEDPMEEARMAERADLTSRIREELLADRRLFASVATGRAAATLAKAGSTIDAEANAAAAEKATKVNNLYDSLKSVSGPIGTALTRGAEDMLNAKSREEKEAIRRRVSDEVGAAILWELGGDPEPIAAPSNEAPTLSLFG